MYERVKELVLNSEFVKAQDKEFQEGIDACVLANPSLFERSETDLIINAKKGGIEFGVIDRRIKIALWSAYAKCCEDTKQVPTKKIVAEITPWYQFQKDWLERPYKAAWLLSPPKDYINALNALHVQAVERIEELLQLDIYRTVKGNRILDAKRAELLLKTIDMVDKRLHGKPVERSITAKIGEIGPAFDLDSEIKKLEAKLGVQSKEDRTACEPEVVGT
jgi:hypothetical protein